MTTSTPFQVTEYEQVGYPPTLRFRYQSDGMRFRDASKFAAALSYAMGCYASVISEYPNEEPRYEWWYAGTLWCVGFYEPKGRIDAGLIVVPERCTVELSDEAASDKRKRAEVREQRYTELKEKRAGQSR